MEKGFRLISFLFFLLLIFSCQNKQRGDSALPPPPRENLIERYYSTVVKALETLREDPMLHNAAIGYLIVDITATEPVVVADYHSKDPMIPASTLKIFVTGAALEYFGSPIIPEVNVTNLMSVNWRSSKLLRKIGNKVYKKPTTRAGVQALLDFWQTKGVDTTGMYFYDGNGLSRNNAISPKQLVDALYAMRTSPYYREFYNSLPVAGLTGTLHRAMKNSAAVGRVRAKTGTINNVKSFAGYVSTVNGRQLVFSLIVNNYDGRVKQMKKKLESVMISMAEV
jgi:D-alanyl-D-alanine carboxypeptidase